jgi:hypothetical protein
MGGPGRRDGSGKGAKSNWHPLGLRFPAQLAPVLVEGPESHGLVAAAILQQTPNMVGVLLDWSRGVE